jgi:FdrA protein
MAKTTITRNIVKRNLFRDSVQMMFLSQELKKISGVEDAAMVMGTELNKDALLRCGMLTNDGATAKETDTIISLTCDSEESLHQVLAKAEDLLVQKPSNGKSESSTIEGALAILSDANVACLSLPGQYVKEVAMKLIGKNMHIFAFSDHVSIEDEIALKQAAIERHLLFMGPEAGTSIISGTILGFGNMVRSGQVGIIGASGTGIQESSTLLHSFGSGITHAIGVGGRDLKIGGLMTRQSIIALEEDPATKAVLLVSKPVDAGTRKALEAMIESKSKKPYVLCLIGDKEKQNDTSDTKFAKSIQVAVLKSLKIVDPKAHKKAASQLKKGLGESVKFAQGLLHTLPPRQKYIRGFFAGGTLCYEAKSILEEMLGPTFSNLSSDPDHALNGYAASKRHTLIDFGNDEFTSSRPHPIIDPSQRISRILAEARDPAVRIIIMDLITGYGVAERTVEQHAKAIRQAINIAGKENRTLPIFVYVCGTDQDVSEAEIGELRKAGPQVFNSNSLMSFVAGLATAKLTPSARLRIVSDYLGDELQ